jgi:hypothetical protein
MSEYRSESVAPDDPVPAGDETGVYYIVFTNVRTANLRRVFRLLTGLTRWTKTELGTISRIGFEVVIAV